MLPHPLTNFWIQKYCQNETKFNGTYSLNNLGNKIKDRVYVINLDEYADIDTHWIALCVLNNDVTYFDSFGVDFIGFIDHMLTGKILIDWTYLFSPHSFNKSEKYWKK